MNGSNIVRDPLRAQRSLGFAPHTTGLYQPLTVEENLRFFGALAGLRRRHLVRWVSRSPTPFSSGVCDAVNASNSLEARSGACTRPSC